MLKIVTVLSQIYQSRFLRFTYGKIINEHIHVHNTSGYSELTNMYIVLYGTEDVNR